MTAITELSDRDLEALHGRVRADYEAFQARGLKLDMTRGKPAPDQLSLSAGLLTLPGNGDFTSEAGEDARNYGNLQGLAEARALYAPILGTVPSQVVADDNSSLALMHDCLLWALVKGVPGGARPWGKDEVPAFICPVPGYDRHFAICEEYGMRMIPVGMTADGPDMDEVERIALDPAVKGIWCVPRYSNPSGEVYSEATIRRLAAMKTGAPDFRLFWDDAYAVHHLTDTRHTIANILEVCAEAGAPDRALVFASTSKVTMPGAGIAYLAASPANIAWYLGCAGKRSIGPDKLNQLRHVRFLRDVAGIDAHMDKQRALLAPKFAAVQAALETRLSGTGAARWTKPEGGYFVSVDVRPGSATRVVELAKQAGVALTPAGATWPGGVDPHDSNLRLAPTFPTLAEVRLASEGIAVCILLAVLEAEARSRTKTD